jgi:cyclohexanone monooxygenase
LQQEWHWSERFAAQPEILAYARHVAKRFDLRRDIRFDTLVTDAAWDDASWLWRIATNRGESLSARYFFMATGCLSAARLPDIPGLADFKGQQFHTGYWPHHKVDFTGRRVAVIGTGSSAIQSIPVIAEQAAQLTVFQRTPNFSIPSRNRLMDDEYEHGWKRDYTNLRHQARMMRTGILYGLSDTPAMSVSAEERKAEYEKRWAVGGTAFMGSFRDLLLDQAANDTAAEFVRGKIRETVKDPATAAKLCPRNHPIGTKRICVDTQYYETYNRPNVTLIDLHEAPITRITANGIEAGGALHEFDDIVFATGFDAMTGALLGVDIKGRADESLNAKWEAGPRTLLGIMTAGFPNMFMITGPGSPSVLSNMIVSIEQHVDWILDCLAQMQAKGQITIEADRSAEDEWVEEVNKVAHRTLYPRAASWYMGANVPGKPRLFMPYVGGVGNYRVLCDEIASESYRGFHFGGAERPAVAAE